MRVLSPPPAALSAEVADLRRRGVTVSAAGSIAAGAGGWEARASTVNPSMLATVQALPGAVAAWERAIDLGRTLAAGLPLARALARRGVRARVVPVDAPGGRSWRALVTVQAPAREAVSVSGGERASFALAWLDVLQLSTAVGAPLPPLPE